MPGERLVEVPWMEKMLQEYEGTILDVGSAGTDLTEARRQKRDIVRVDKLFERDDFSNEKEILISGDIRSLNRDGLGLFNIVMLVSSLEHIGLDAYGFNDRKGDPWEEQIKTLLHCSSFLICTGVIILTLPYGKEEDGGWYLIYSEDRLRRLIKPFVIVRKDYFSLDFSTWTYNHVEMDQCHDLGADWVRPDFSRASNAVCLVLRRKNV